MVLREYWVNVYVLGGVTGVGFEYPDRETADDRAHDRKPRNSVVHVRLKPKGAPARYSNEHDRRNWEQYPEEMRKCPF